VKLSFMKEEDNTSTLVTFHFILLSVHRMLVISHQKYYHFLEENDNTQNKKNKKIWISGFNTCIYHEF
jgi:hypothetical protein